MASLLFLACWKQETCSHLFLSFLLSSPWVHCQPLSLRSQLGNCFLASLGLEHEEEREEKMLRRLLLVRSCCDEAKLPTVWQFQESFRKLNLIPRHLYPASLFVWFFVFLWPLVT